MAVVKLGQKAVNKAVEVLISGGIVIFPTDTVYGFLSDAGNKKAVNRIFKIKKRAKNHPLPVFVSSIKKAKELAQISRQQEKILKKYWPGKYTFVLNRMQGTNLYGLDKKTIALRIPKYKFLNILLKKIKSPLIQTSVNVSGKSPLNKIDDIIKQFSQEDVLIVDGGNVKNNKSSKIIDLRGSNIKIIRK